MQFKEIRGSSKEHQEDFSKLLLQTSMLRKANRTKNINRDVRSDVISNVSRYENQEPYMKTFNID